jgi:hypothetical protein
VLVYLDLIMTSLYPRGAYRAHAKDYYLYYIFLGYNKVIFKCILFIAYFIKFEIKIINIYYILFIFLYSICHRLGKVLTRSFYIKDAVYYEELS